MLSAHVDSNLVSVPQESCSAGYAVVVCSGEQDYVAAVLLAPRSDLVLSSKVTSHLVRILVLANAHAALESGDENKLKGVNSNKETISYLVPSHQSALAFFEVLLLNTSMAFWPSNMSSSCWLYNSLHAFLCPRWSLSDFFLKSHPLHFFHILRASPLSLSGGAWEASLVSITCSPWNSCPSSSSDDA